MRSTGTRVHGTGIVLSIFRFWKKKIFFTSTAEVVRRLEALNPDLVVALAGHRATAASCWPLPSPAPPQYFLLTRISFETLAFLGLSEYWLSYWRAFLLLRLECIENSKKRIMVVPHEMALRFKGTTRRRRYSYFGSLWKRINQITMNYVRDTCKTKATQGMYL